MPLNDYFRASGPDVAARALDQVGGPLIADPAPGELTFDGVAVKNADPAVALGQLVAFVREVPWDPDVVRSDLLRPEETPEQGPWLVWVDDATRDTLAGIAEDRIPELAERWAAIEEFGGYADADDLRDLIAALAELARRATAAGDHLYCWMCL
jgi:hypothetical protein